MGQLERDDEQQANWRRYNSPAVAKTILAGGGFNWTLIDAEHGQITDADYFTVCADAMDYLRPC